MKQKKCIINFNHISENLDDDEITSLKSYYITYHRKCWCYKYMLKRLKKFKLMLSIGSGLFATSGIISSIVTNGIALIAISGVAILIESYKSYKNLEMKIYFCDYSYKEYQHLLNQIKENLRIGNYDEEALVSEMKRIDDIVTDHAIPIENLYKKYNNKFTC